MSEYDGINNLNELEVATPLDGASYAELAQSIRQLKSVVKNVLLTAHKPNGALKGVSVDLLSNSSVGTAQLIDGSVTSNKLSASCVTTAKIASGAITADKLATGSVTTVKIADGAIVAAAFADNSIPLRAIPANLITGAKIAQSASVDTDRAIVGDHIRNGAIVDRHVTAVGVNKLTGGSSGQILVRGASSWSGVSLSGSLTIDPVTGAASFTDILKAAKVADTKTRGSNGGASLANTWMTRDLGEIVDTNALLNFSGNAFSLVAGKYLIYMRCPAHGAVGKHQARLIRDDGTGAFTVAAWGTSSSGNTGTDTESCIIALIDEAGTVGHSYKVEHWFENAVASNGLGLAASSDNTVAYANHAEVYTSGFIVRI